MQCSLCLRNIIPGEVVICTAVVCPMRALPEFKGDLVNRPPLMGGEQFVSMINFRDRLFVATTFRVFELVDNKLAPVEFAEPPVTDADFAEIGDQSPLFVPSAPSGPNDTIAETVKRTVIKYARGQSPEEIGAVRAYCDREFAGGKCPYPAQNCLKGSLCKTEIDAALKDFHAKQGNP